MVVSGAITDVRCGGVGVSLIVSGWSCRRRRSRRRGCVTRGDASRYWGVPGIGGGLVARGVAGGVVGGIEITILGVLVELGMVVVLEWELMVG